MSNNCLVTKLKAVVDNNNLPKLGVIEFSVMPQANGFVSMFASEDGKCTVEIVGNTVSEVRGSNTLIDSTHVALNTRVGQTNAGFILGNVVETRVIVKYKYVISVLNPVNIYAPFSIDDLKYMEGLEIINISDASPASGLIAGDIDVFSGLTNLTTLSLPKATQDDVLYGNLASLSDLTSLGHVNLANSKNVEGLLSSLGGLTDITFIKLSNTKVSGTIENFVTAQRAAGRTECAGIQMPYIGLTEVTYNGSTITPSSTTTLSWDSQGNITLS